MANMALGALVVKLRKQKGITQEELAGLTNVTVRTIQRIERGQSVPRNFTLKAIATALDVPFESLSQEEVKLQTIIETQLSSASTDLEDEKHFLTVFCLSCFSFIVIPYIHFLIPRYLLKRRNETTQPILRFAKLVIRQQIIWVVAFHLLLLFTLIYNMSIASLGHRSYLINYLWIVCVMYLSNIVLIGYQLFKVSRAF